MEQRHPDEQYPCVYTITNALTGEQYVGCTVDKYYRWKVHRSTLRCGTHNSLSLQAAWKRDGEAAFVFAVVERLPADISYRDLLVCEQVWLNKLQPAYNVTGCCNTYVDASKSIRSLRIHRGWTQAELAHQASTNSQTITAIETGRRIRAATSQLD